MLRARIWEGGSAFWLGHAAVRAGIRAADGRGEPTILFERIIEKLQLPAADGLVKWFYDQEHSRHRVTQLAGLVEEAAPKRIWLSCTKGEFRGLKPFIGKEYLRARSPFADYDPDGVVVLPYVLSETKRMPGEQDHRSIPPGELAVRRG